ncbi:hypothetical protein D9M72_476890 [compost metagenome]
MGDEAAITGKGTPECCGTGPLLLRRDGDAKARAPDIVDVSQHEEHGDQADDQAKEVPRDVGRGRPADEDAGDGAGQQHEEGGAIAVLAPHPKRDEIHRDQDREEEGGRLDG